MNGLDTNVLLRLFTSDQPAQTVATRRLLEESGPGSFRVTNILLVELVWALISHYEADAAEVIDILEQLLGREELVFESRSATMTALLWFSNGKADFADYLMAALNEEAGAAPTYTFDRKAGRHVAFSLIKP
jgi:predicted nucleic-acid-binding protein